MNAVIKKWDIISPNAVRKVFEQLENFSNLFSQHVYIDCQKAGIPCVKLRLSRDNTHFVERLIEREVNRKDFSSCLKKLFTEHLCELIYLTQYHEKEFRLLATYKSAMIVFQVKPVGKHIEVTPCTCGNIGDMHFGNVEFKVAM